MVPDRLLDIHPGMPHLRPRDRPARATGGARRVGEPRLHPYALQAEFDASRPRHWPVRAAGTDAITGGSVRAHRRSSAAGGGADVSYDDAATWAAASLQPTERARMP